MKDKSQRSLRIKVGRIITGFSFFMVVFYSYMLLLLKDSGLRDATHSVLTHEAQLFVDAYKDNPNAPLPESYSLKGYIGTANLPSEITKIFPLDQRGSWHQRKSGVYYRLVADKSIFWHHHMVVEALPDSNEELFLYYRLSISRDSTIDIWRNVKQVALLGFVLVIVMLLILRKFIHRALKPLSSLSLWIDQLNDKEKPKPLPNDIQDDEIGQLANNLFQALERINAHNERERSFLRNASHELRTPIAIIRNTMDVIEYKRDTGNQDIDRLLYRIRRASDTMKAVTEAILWLAVDEYSAPNITETNLEELLSQVIEENRNLAGGQDININTNIEQLSVINAESTLVHITLDNLVRNAFQHCAGGDIQVVAKDPFTVEISNARQDCANTTEDDNNEYVNTGGFGLGLALVQKIAEKKSWTFDFSLQDDYATACLKFA